MLYKRIVQCAMIIYETKYRYLTYKYILMLKLKLNSHYDNYHSYILLPWLLIVFILFSKSNCLSMSFVQFAYLFMYLCVFKLICMHAKQAGCFDPVLVSFLEFWGIDRLRFPMFFWPSSHRHWHKLVSIEQSDAPTWQEVWESWKAESALDEAVALSDPRFL